MNKDVVVQLQNIDKVFRVGVQDVHVLKSVSFDIYKADFLVVFGPSGCGKSTLLHTILGLEPPTSGNIKYFGEDLYENSTEDTRSDFRKRHIGMVYQQSNWIRSLNVLENVSFPLTLLGFAKHDAFNKAMSVLKTVSMEKWASYVPTELSSGQQQRVSLARALINDPQIIVADEPTGNLDYNSGQDIMELLSNMSKSLEKTIVMVTHDLEYLKYSTRIVKMFDGELVGIYDGSEKDKVISSVQLKRGAETVKVNESVSVEKENEGKN